MSSVVSNDVISRSIMAPEGAILVIALLMVSSSGANQILMLVHQEKIAFIHEKSCGREKFSILRKIADYLALLLLTQGVEPNPGPTAGAFADNTEVSKKQQTDCDTENIGDTDASKDTNPMARTCLDIYRAKMESAVIGLCATPEYKDIVTGAPYLARGIVRLKTSLELFESKPLATSTPMSSPLGMTEDEGVVSVHGLSAIEVALPPAIVPYVVYKPDSRGTQYTYSVNDKLNNTSYTMMDRFLDTSTRRALPRGRKSYDDSLLEISHTGVLNCQRLKKRLRQEEKAQRETRKIDERQSNTSYIEPRITRQESQEEGYHLTPRQVRKRIRQLKRLLERKRLVDEEPMWVPVVRLVPHPSPNPCDDDDDDDEIMDRSFTPSGIQFHDTPGMAYLAALAESQHKENKGRYTDTEELYGLSVFYQETSDHSNVQDKQKVFTTDERNKKGHLYDDVRPEYLDLFCDKKHKAEKCSEKQYFDGKDTAKVTANKIENTTGIVKFFRRFFT